MDYRILNQHTEVDVTPLPLIPQIYDDLHDKVLFSKFNIHWGYNNIQIAKEDRWKTGFKMTRGLFESNVMPFGLCNTPATFSRMGLAIFRPLEVKYPGRCQYYMDDFGTFTKEGEEELHREINNAFFKVLDKVDLYLRPEKCIFEQLEMDFLRIHIKNSEISIDPSKIAGIKEYDEMLKSVKEVRKFLGMVRYQRPFIRDFAKLAKPLTDLTKKSPTFELTPEATEAVKALKKAITSEPVLVPPDPHRQFELETDASLFTTGAILY